MQGFQGSDPTVVIGKALVSSLAISLLMMLTSLGFMYLFSGMSLPISTAIVLVVFAISFIAGTVLLERASDDLAASFMGGAAIASSVTIFIVAVVSGAYFLMDGMALPGPDMLLTGFAVCLVASLVINRLTLKLF